jgi:hypothetical protein
MRALAAVLALVLAVILPARAEMSGDEAFARAMAYFQSELNKRDAEAAKNKALMDSGPSWAQGGAFRTG